MSQPADDAVTRGHVHKRRGLIQSAILRFAFLAIPIAISVVKREKTTGYHPKNAYDLHESRSHPSDHHIRRHRMVEPEREEHVAKLSIIVTMQPIMAYLMRKSELPPFPRIIRINVDLYGFPVFLRTNPPTLLSNGVSTTSASNCSAIFSGSTGTVRCPSDELTVSKRALTASWKGSFTIAPPTRSFHPHSLAISS